jgi:hypothetical protein
LFLRPSISEILANQPSQTSHSPSSVPPAVCVSAATQNTCCSSSCGGQVQPSVPCDQDAAAATLQVPGPHSCLLPIYAKMG